MKPPPPRLSGCLLVLSALLLLTPLAPARDDDDDDDAPRKADPPPSAEFAGKLILDRATGKPAVGSLPVNFVRSPDTRGPGGGGRYLVAVNSGYGLQFDARSNRGQQSLAVIDLNARPAPAVVQNVYFPSPQSANVGVAFAPPAPGGAELRLYVSGGFENKVWRFRFKPGARTPISPGSPGPGTRVRAKFIDLAPLATVPRSKRYNDNTAAVYPTGLAAAEGYVFTANDLGDSLGIIADPNGRPKLARVDLRRRVEENVYPYGVVAAGFSRPDGSRAVKVYVSLWNASAVAAVEWPPLPGGGSPLPPVFIATGSHPTAMLLDGARQRLYVANSNDDTVSVIDTAGDREVERVRVRLTEGALFGASPQGLALSADGGTLYVANARADAVAVVRLGDRARGGRPAGGKEAASRVFGLIPTGRYPSALALVGRTLFVGNGKGTGAANSSNTVNTSGLYPNAPGFDFPPRLNGKGHHEGRGGAYSVSLVAGNLLAVPVPDERALAADTALVLRRQGLTGETKRPAVFAGRAGGSPIRHVIYLIKENRTYDQVFGDLRTSGDGTPADGDASLAIFGAGEAARRPGGPPQDIAPNHRALALRFGLLDRFFVNSEASADGHNWSTAAFSSDYVDKVYRWNYSGRGRTYDFEGFNRLPDTGRTGGEPLFTADLTADTLGDFLRQYLPYTHGGTDVGEPATLYLWDLAARAGLSYRNYGEFVATASAEDLAAARANRSKKYPDLSPTIVSVPAKSTLIGHYCPTARNFDMNTPDALTVDSYRAAGGSGPGSVDPLISNTQAVARFRGTSRTGAWLEEFSRAAADLAAGRGDTLPALSIVRLSNDHTSGLAPGRPSPQFYVADNDYALGRIVEAVSNSPYWKDTAVVAVEDDAQDGPDHVDCHRSVALIVSAYNRPGCLVHDFRTTAGLIRTMEQLLGLPPMNAHDDAAAPIDVFRDGPPDLTPYVAALPRLDPAGLVTPRVEAAPDAETAAAIRRNDALDFSHPDAAEPLALNTAIWLSVRGPAVPVPGPAHLPAFDLLRGADDDDD